MKVRFRVVLVVVSLALLPVLARAQQMKPVWAARAIVSTRSAAFSSGTTHSTFVMSKLSKRSMPPDFFGAASSARGRPRTSDTVKPGAPESSRTATMTS